MHFKTLLCKILCKTVVNLVIICIYKNVAVCNVSRPIMMEESQDKYYILPLLLNNNIKVNIACRLQYTIVDKNIGTVGKYE